ncbi:hypothetical protein JKP88DRAFT_142242, partial [Tribonema minus]
DDADTQQQGWLEVAALASSYLDSSRLGAAGACGLVVQMLHRHAQDVKVQENGWKAAVALAYKDAGNRRRLCAAGVLEQLVQAVKGHMPHAGVQLIAWWAAGRLAVDQASRLKLGSAGACALLVQAFRAHRSSDVREVLQFAASKLTDDCQEN